MSKNTFLNKVRKGQEKAISPVIATIILIAVALVLALTVGVFAFGLFSAHASTVSIGGGVLTTGGAFTFSLNNPSGTAVTLNGGTGVTVDTGTCVSLPTSAPAHLSTLITATCIVETYVAGNNYNYIINLGNGQIITGVVVAQ